MQFLVSVIFDGPGLATTAEMAAIDIFNERLTVEGHWVFAGGLADPSSAKVVDNRGAETIVTDGPQISTGEFVAGLWIWTATDLDEALELAVEGSKACNRKLEVRPLLGT